MAKFRVHFEASAAMAEKLSRDVKIATIRAAANYRSGNDSCNSVYMGSMAIAGLMHALGGDYGMSDLDSLLTAATDQQLDAGLEKCRHTIDYMRANPIRRCPCCGLIVPAKLKGNSF